MALLIGFLIVGWVAAAVLGTQTYFRGEQTKPIHLRNWRSDSFERIARNVTGRETNYQARVPAYSGDAYTSSQLPIK
ncbi:hypothetical protein XM38_040490 [Halomicronema hongdechloris C2206]|uniref:Uncharacterized protein n=1 Tax=Halomicronema hongdechloris C2206 TaxID=1641165 RepID=A0A1Z3HSI3_9CYAN|nr:hypothetical protein [Halomicronema hongdechloris]ASC73087.1 hypothetical protein XM38_040490 [Halomicronema hongdechloris C2206]